MKHEIRKAELFAIAQRLFFSAGYKAVPVADIIREAGIAKGTFYHYFESKEDLLDGTLEHFLAEPLELMQRIADDPELNGREKLQRIIDAGSTWKARNPESITGLVRMLYRDENVLLRKKLRDRQIRFIVPLFDRIIRQGTEEKIFDTPYPEEAGELLVLGMNGMNEVIAELFLTLDSLPENLDILEKKYRIMEYFICRMLGLPEGSINFGGREITLQIRGLEPAQGEHA